ncbi:MAG: lipoyl(octanoyl) transferase LipB, partial [Candidatus Marinimicrobia bacterium]|nr:lipoyl(octanoyl) transferase LipB [Candidatus Neomarinimicrobiota bacterium]MBT4065173.1 lipoyl(octanoyl) transferase LipB [Candidatus Neomarinimicrobiota bacterium]MBT6781631.1 lipoyl(octanoyl) transferase LipB [Candidatus Neomarinimicrobiota bacterium]
MLRQTQGDNYYQKMDNKIKIVDLGYMDYQSAWEYQKDYHQKVLDGVSEDTLLLVEHEPVYTLGKNANEDHLLQSAPKNTKVFNIDRGGDITYHGPGQIVGYPILDLHHYKKSVSWYMRALENIIIRVLDEYG